jgi:hypothetical protein
MSLTEPILRRNSGAGREKDGRCGKGAIRQCGGKNRMRRR